MLTISKRLTLSLTALSKFALAQTQGGQQLPDFFTSELKDKWGDLETTEPSYGDDACQKRLSILKTMNTISNPQMGHFKAAVLEDLGFCMVRSEDYNAAYTRFVSAISEVEMITHRSELDFLKMPQLQFYAPLVFNKQAALSMKSGLFSDAATAFRRTATVYSRNIDKEIRMVAKQNKIATADELKNNFDQVKQKILPQMQQHKQFRQINEKVALGEEILKRIDKASVYNSQRQRSLSAEKYLPGLLYRDTTWNSGHPILTDLLELKSAWPKKLAEGRMISLVSPTKAPTSTSDSEDSTDDVKKSSSKKKSSKKSSELAAQLCDSSIWPEFCKLFQDKKYFSDFGSNIFGGTKILNGKNKNSQKLESCESNAVVGVVMSEKPFTLLFPATNVGSTPAAEEKVEVEANTPTFLNFCRAVEIVKRETPVLFMQLWHPEVAPIERTSLIRGFYKKSKEHANDLAKLVNDATAQWEKTRKEWQKTAGEHHNIILKDLEGKAKALAREKQTKQELESELDSEEERKKGVEKLEEERSKKAEQAKKQKEWRAKQAKAREEKKKNEKAWIDTVIKMKKFDSEDPKSKEETSLSKEIQRLDDLKAEKRDLDKALDFGQAKEIVGLINKQERRLKSAEKLAKKAYEKEGSKSEATSEEKKEEKKKEKEKKVESEKKEEKKADKEEKKPKSDEKKSKSEDKETTKETTKTSDVSISDLKTKLEKVKREKKEAAMKDDFKKAKSLKAEAKKLEEQIASLEKAEL